MTGDVIDTRKRRRSRPVATPGKASRYLLWLPALALAVLFAYLGGRLLLAGVASYQAQRFLEDWVAKEQAPQPRAWQVAHAAAQRAVHLYPGANGEYLERLARIQQWQYRTQPIGEDSAKASRQAAASSFREAIAARPTWPYNWTGLAYTKLLLLEIDEEFAEAMQQAHRLAPTRLDINRSLAEMGLLAWLLLEEPEEQLTLEAARRVFTYSQREARSLAERASASDMLEEVCEYLDSTQTETWTLCE